MIHIDLKNPKPRSLESDQTSSFNTSMLELQACGSPDLGRHFEKLMTKDTCEVPSELTSLWDSDSSHSNSILATKQ